MTVQCVLNLRNYASFSKVLKSVWRKFYKNYYHHMNVCKHWRNWIRSLLKDQISLKLKFLLANIRTQLNDKLVNKIQDVDRKGIIEDVLVEYPLLRLRNHSAGRTYSRCHVSRKGRPFLVSIRVNANEFWQIIIHLS